MEKMLKKPDYAKEILAIMHGSFSKEEMLDRIADYHENDIAEAFELLSESERKSWYKMFGPEQIAEIFSYIDDPDSYLKELPLDEAAKVLSLWSPHHYSAGRPAENHSLLPQSAR